MFLTDRLGTPYRMIDAGTHEVLWERDADPWGNTLREWMSEKRKEEHRPTSRFQRQHYDCRIDFCCNRHRICQLKNKHRGKAIFFGFSPTRLTSEKR